MDTSSRQALKAQAHHLKPVVLIGAKGLTDAVINETEHALVAHELIKVKINGAEKEDRQLMSQELCERLNAVLVQSIGNTAINCRGNKDNK